jgi:hypothetical protein
MKTTTVFLLLLALVAISNPAKPYWAKVGWNADKTLNPCKYTLCLETETEISP